MADLNDSQFGILCHDRIEIVCGISNHSSVSANTSVPGYDYHILPENKVTRLVRLPSFHESYVSLDSAFHQVLLALELSSLSLCGICMILGQQQIDQTIQVESKETDLTWPCGSFLSGTLPSWTGVPRPVGVKKAGIPAAPARMRSARVPCGVNSSSISPDK